MATTINAGSSVTLALLAGDSVRVVAPPNAQGAVVVTQSGQSFLSGGSTALSPITVPFGPVAMDRTFGPYPVGATVVISCALLTVDYTQTVVATSFLVSKDAATGVWRNLPASGVIMRVRMTGTGTVSMDSATGDLGAGTVTTGVYTATVSGTQIDDYAYPGDAARSIRFTLTGTAAVEVY